MEFLQNERQFSKEEAQKAIDSVNINRRHHHHHHNIDDLNRPNKLQKLINHAKRQLKLYRNCPCGSGIKNRWCCDKKETLVINTDDNSKG